MQTSNQILPLIQMLATAAGSGYVGQVLFKWLRQTFPCPMEAPKTWRSRAFYNALFAPRHARTSVFLLSAWIAIAASAVVAIATGMSVSIALDATLSVIIGQLIHGEQTAGTAWKPNKESLS